MKNLSDQLLKETFEENGYASFRDQVYRESLGEFKRRIRTRRWANRFFIAACFLGLISLLAIFRQRGTSERGSSLFIIASQPLLESQMIFSMPNTFERIGPERAPFEVVQGHGDVGLIRPDPVEYPVRLMSDNELMAAFRGHAVALGAVGPNSKRLVFLDSDDRNRFFGKEPH